MVKGLKGYNGMGRVKLRLGMGLQRGEEQVGMKSSKDL